MNTLKLGGFTLGSGGGSKPNGNPSALTLTVLSDTSIKCDWTNGATNQDGTYVLYKLHSDSDWSTLTALGALTTKNITELTASSNYDVKVVHYKGSKLSEYSNILNIYTLPSYSRLLFIGDTSLLTDGKIYNQITGETDYITVTGSPATYMCPNTAEYKSADIDYFWFYNSGSNRVVTTADLIGYDISKTPVKYDSESPYTVRKIVILKSGTTLTTDEERSLHQYLELPYFWSGALSDLGYVKDNRGGTEQVPWVVPWVNVLDGSTVGWYMSDDLSTITKDVSDRVSIWADKLGVNNLSQAGADNLKPVLVDKIMTFDGVRQYIGKAFDWVQPEYIYLVVNQKTWTLNDYLFDGNGNSLGAVFQSAATPGIKGWAGGTSAQNSNLAVDTWAILRVQFLSNAHKLQVGATAVTAWNTGTNDMGGFVLGCKNLTAPQGYSNIHVKEIILRNVADYGTSASTNIYNYLKTKYGI